MAGAAGPKPSLEWYQVYEWTSFVDVSSFSYTLDRSSTAPSFSRILYIMALDDYAVWIEFDDFTSNTANRIGVPLSWTYETNVTNMIVKYSRPGIFPGADNATIYNRITPVTGRINFWPSNYGPTGENDGLYDSDDSGYDSGDGYGSFQFFDVSVSPSQCIYAWNYWGTSADFGLGNKSGGHPDWTFTYNVNSFPYKLGRIYVK
jgi:hypothetical protein